MRIEMCIKKNTSCLEAYILVWIFFQTELMYQMLDGKRFAIIIIIFLFLMCYS